MSSSPSCKLSVQRPLKDNYIVYIEGNIGAGKTTVLKNLAKLYSSENCTTATEPISKWPTLPLFYQDKRKYAFQLQMEIFDSLYCREANDIMNLQRTPQICIYERSLFSSLNIFAKLNCVPQELQKLTKVYHDLEFHNKHRLYIYIRTPAMYCCRNIQQRQKSVDSKIDPDYVKLLEKCHDECFSRNSSNGMDHFKCLNRNYKISVIYNDGTMTKEDMAIAVKHEIDAYIRER